FGGETPSDVIASVLLQEPPPLTHEEQEVPQELQRIVSKALHKNREARYQTANELLGELKDLRRQMEITAELERSGVTGGQGRVKDRSGPVSEKSERRNADASPSTPGATALFRMIKRGKFGAAIIIGALLVAAVVYFFYLAQR
ncbi:MAG TPA: hypothetical protein VF819_01505, partial [Nitrospira sp.]